MGREGRREGALKEEIMTRMTKSRCTSSTSGCRAFRTLARLVIPDVTMAVSYLDDSEGGEGEGGASLRPYLSNLLQCQVPTPNLINGAKFAALLPPCYGRYPRVSWVSLVWHCDIRVSQTCACLLA